MLYGGDAQWWRNYWREVEQTESEHWAATGVTAGMDGALDVHLIPAIGPEDAQGMSRGGERIHTGGNSGFAAVNLAALWGAARIVLTGFDMQATGGRKHVHADHPESLGNPPDSSFPIWRERFAEAAKDLRAMGVEVFNASRTTALHCFERRPLAELLDRPPVVIAGMLGLGDNLYQRPFVRELSRGHDVYLRTPWPQLYADLPVTCARSNTTLRTQFRNENDESFAEQMQRAEYELRKLAKRRPDLGVRQATYVQALWSKDGTMWSGLARSMGVEPTTPLDLPPLPPSPVRSDKPICLVRPVTVRAEWKNPARNPEPMQVAQVVHWLRAEGMHVVSVADLADKEEWALEPLPEADERFHAGELDALQLLALVQASAAVVGGVGWIVPAAIAAHVPAFIVLGGQGGHNAPERLTAPSMDVELIGWGVPNAFCRCSAMRHHCRKENTRLREQFDEWRLRVAVGAPAAVAA